MLSNNSNNTNYDHRDVIIQRLQQEVDDMRKNEQDYSELNFLLTNLEHRYNLLNEEKIRNENDFIQRQEEHLKTIADLQCAVDNNNQMLNQKDQEMEEAYIQISALKDLDKHREQDVDQMKQELYDISSAYNNLKEDNILLENQAKKLEDEKAYVEKEIEKLNQLVEDTYSKHLNLGKENKNLQEKLEAITGELDHYKSEVQNRSNEIKDLQDQLEIKSEQNIKELKNLEKNYKEKLEFQRKEFKELENRLCDENERNHNKFVEEFDKERNSNEEKTLEFVNSNKEMLKQLEIVFENEEILREKVESQKKIKEQTILQEKSIRIALKELQEELIIERNLGVMGRNNITKKTSINNRVKGKD